MALRRGLDAEEHRQVGAHQRLPGAQQRGVAATGADRFVEGEVGADPDRVGLLDEPLEVRVAGADHLERRLDVPATDPQGRRRLQGQADFGDVRRLLWAQPADEDTAPGFGDEQAFLLERAQRFPEDPATQLELPGQLDLVDPLSGLQLAGDDHLADHGGRVGAQSGRLLGPQDRVFFPLAHAAAV